jgi:hypothetical protein
MKTMESAPGKTAAPNDTMTAPITYIEAINQALHEEMERDERIFLLGEDIAATAASSRPPRTSTSASARCA